MVYQQANMLWHSDSSFKPVLSLCSLLSARIVPPEGGATEFASTRAAYPALPDALKARAERAIAVHDFAWSRDQVRPGFFTAEEYADLVAYILSVNKFPTGATEIGISLAPLQQIRILATKP